MSKEITMSIHEFMEMERGNITLKQITQNNDLESIASKIVKNKQLTRFVVVSTAFICMSINAYANETTEAISQIQNAENQIVPVILAIIGSICTICCIAQIGKSLITSKGADVGQIVMRYVLAFAGSCAVPWIFRIIRGMFKLG
jgi:hypothetical protein